MTNCGRVRGAAARDLDVARRRQRARLRPFLHRGLGVALGLDVGVHARAPGAHHQIARGLEAGVDEHGADDRFADVGEDRRLLAPAGARLALPHHDMRADVPFLGDRGAGLAAHQLGQPHRQFALARLRIGLVEHVARRRRRARGRPGIPAADRIARAPARRRAGAERWVSARAIRSRSRKRWPMRSSSAASSALAFLVIVARRSRLSG